MTSVETQTAPMDPELLWQAFQSRDRSRDGTFICAVRSTGIYCRPTCPSRRPRRSQVQFYALPEEAREAGYRACLRCEPDRLETDTDFVITACAFIDDFLDTHETVPSSAALAEALGLSRARLQRLFKQETGITSFRYARAKRLERFKALTREGGSVSQATYEAGFGSSSRLYESASKQLGMTPATYGKGGLGAVVHYAVTTSALGCLLVAGTQSGVCAVKLGDRPDPLVSELEREFPGATLVRTPPDDDTAEGRRLRGWTAALLEYLDGGRVDIDLPLDVVATAFQWRVWRKLQEIPDGQTRTYQEMAADLQKPTASRAVGRACATNPVAPIIPCHRAVRKDGGLAGYRWGLHRKEALLEMERRRSG